MIILSWPVFPSIFGGSETYVGTPAMVIVVPTDVPWCLKVVKQQSPDGPARVRLVLVDMEREESER